MLLNTKVGEANSKSSIFEVEKPKMQKSGQN